MVHAQVKHANVTKMIKTVRTPKRARRHANAPALTMQHFFRNHNTKMIVNLEMVVTETRKLKRKIVKHKIFAVSFTHSKSR